MDDLEQQCEDAVFEVCDARERYPLQCANELEKSIKLTNEIYMTKIFAKPSDSTSVLDVPFLTNEHLTTFQKNFTETTELLKTHEHKLQVMTDKINNLTAVLDQIKKDNLCEFNKLLWN